jgi:hypothetical protein
VKLAYNILWLCWAAMFFALELTALFTKHSNLTLSDYVWRLEEVSTGWTFLRYVVAVMSFWLFLHLTFDILKLLAFACK